MELYFSGACHEVTGSAHLLKINNKYVLVDYGMKQGINMYENVPLPIKASQIDYLLVTHAHIDHTGNIPILVKNGFMGDIICTYATKDLLEIMLKDCAHIQEQEANLKNKNALRKGEKQVEPVFNIQDVEKTLNLIKAFHYNDIIKLFDGLEINFVDAGHILGSSSIELFATEGNITKKIVFSGDIGNDEKPIIKNPTYIQNANYVIMESTYGDRFHKKDINHEDDLMRIIQETLDRRGNVVIPAFAVGRTQEILYLIKQIKIKNLIKGHDDFKVVVDSPMAVRATEVYKDALDECFDDETIEMLKKGINPISFHNLNLCITQEESMALNDDMEPKVIISASGMADAGRIRHHIKYNVYRSESSIVFAGYQAEGTLGRLLLDGIKEIKLFGDKFAVKAHIEVINDMSSHADKNGLIKWASAFVDNPKVFLVHGQDEAMESLSEELKNSCNLDVSLPYSGAIYDLINNSWIKETLPIKIEKISSEENIINEIKIKNPALHNLILSIQELLNFAKTLAGRSNKELNKKADEIKQVLKKWEK
ncbi:MAG: MBL fold metallo-hydrolase [Eubacteriales bacterium]|nr:MBL fold metallo-hydrolase [Eubacteriales bacterium]